MTWSFSPGPAAAASCSAPGSSGSGAEDTIRRPVPSGVCGVEVTDLTTSTAASVRTSMRGHLSLFVRQKPPRLPGDIDYGQSRPEHESLQAAPDVLDGCELPPQRPASEQAWSF